MFLHVVSGPSARLWAESAERWVAAFLFKGRFFQWKIGTKLVLLASQPT